MKQVIIELLQALTEAIKTPQGFQKRIIQEIKISEWAINYENKTGWRQ